MVALGIVLAVVSGVFALGVVLSNTSTTQAEAFGVSLSNVSLGGLFLAGVVTGAVLLIGLTLMLAGAARKRHRRQAVRSQVKSVQGESAGLADENVRLHEELEDQRRRSVVPVTSNPYPQTTQGGPATTTGGGQPAAAEGLGQPDAAPQGGDPRVRRSGLFRR